MSKFLVTLLLVISPITYADDLPNPDEDTLANFHLKDETCAGQCHEHESVSDDLVFEYSSCIECHDDFGLLRGKSHNLKHKESESMECVECHLPHEEFAPKDICLDCHDEGDSEIENIYSHRLERYMNHFVFISPRKALSISPSVHN